MSNEREAGQFITSQAIAAIRSHLEAVHRALDVVEGLKDGGSAPIPPPPVQPSTPKFIFGAESMIRLQTLKPELAKVVGAALALSTVDFRVMETTRSMVKQAAVVATGNSRTMHSKHLRQSDGFAWAVDLGVYKGHGEIDWTFSHYAAIALAMDQAATQQSVANHVRWGCAWDRVLSDFGGNEQAYLDEAKAYADRHAGSDLIDAPHFEWVA